MKNLKSLLSKLKWLLLSPLFALFGCIQTAAPLYAAPVYDLDIYGNVKDAQTLDEITNIRLTLLKDLNTIEQTQSYPYFHITKYSVSTGTYVLIAKDTDGDSNGGIYISQTNSLKVTSIPFFTNMTILLDKKIR